MNEKYQEESMCFFFFFFPIYKLDEFFPQKNKMAPPPMAKTKWLKALKLLVLKEEDEGDEDGDDLLESLSAAGLSAEGEMSGAGAGAGVGGISVPKIASGRRTLST